MNKLKEIYMHLLKFVIHTFFLFQSMILISIESIYRFLNKKMKGKDSSVTELNPFKTTPVQVFKSRHEMLKLEGYKIVEFEFKTKDNAYVCFWRIVPQGYKEQDKYQIPQRKLGTPVIIQHGLLDCSMSWFLHKQKNNCLPYLLAELGYDVWVGNNRGTKFSSKNSDDKQYWEYSFDHLAQYDIPCMINSITKHTDYQKLVYIGHSQGTTQFYTSMNLHPELHQKIECFVGLGPVISLMGLEDHQLLKLVSKFKLCEFLKIVGFKTLLIIPNWMASLIGMLIYNSTLYFYLFYMIVVGLCGKNIKSQKINLQRFGIIISHEPGGSSINNVLHWIQMYRQGGTLSRFDYGLKKNMEKYGTPKPPVYTFENLSTMDFNNYLFKGTADIIISEQNFSFLLDKLPENKSFIFQVEDFAHLDYIWSQHATELIYEKILKLLSDQKKQKNKSWSTESGVAEEEDRLLNETQEPNKKSVIQ